MFFIDNFEQILFHLNEPLDGTDPRLIKKIISRILRYSVVYFLVFVIIFKLIRLKFGQLFRVSFLIISIFAISVSLFFYSFKKFKINDYLENRSEKTPFSNYYEENYIVPSSDNIRFNKKNNLIVLFLESFENSYYKKSGLFKESLIPNLENLAETKISFNGFKTVSGTGWTMAGIFATYCGIPIKSIINGNGYSNVKFFFKNVKCLPEILKENGYRTYFLQGDDIKFAGKDKFYSQHGVDEYFGRDYFKNLPEYNKSFDGDWGINDHTLIEYSKKKISEISKNKDKPFMLSILTIDTHHTDGFLNPICQKKYDIGMKNTLLCKDILINDFINWLKMQDFYKNTTIVIVGDHLSMPNTLQNYLDKNKNREIVNIFINSEKKTENLDRIFTTFDLFPTILESMGAESEKLGLGTSLFSDQKTLIEKEGYHKFNKKIYEKSKLYESFR